MGFKNILFLDLEQFRKIGYAGRVLKIKFFEEKKINLGIKDA